MSQDFSFAWNGRGWWNITDISPMSVQLDEVRYVETYEPQRICIPLAKTGMLSKKIGQPVH